MGLRSKSGRKGRAPERTAPSWLPITAVVLLLAAVAWVLMQGGDEETVDLTPAPIDDPIDDPSLAPATIDASGLPLLPGEGPLIVELRWLAAPDAERLAPRQAGSLSGVLTDTGGTAIAGGRLTVVGGPQDGWNAMTNARGEFRLVELLPGTHNLRVETPGRYPTVRRVRVRDDVPTKAYFSVGGPASITMVVRDQDAQPLEGARVILDLGAHEVVTDSTGIARFDGVPIGEPLLQVFADGYVPVQRVMQLPNSGAREAPVELRPLVRGGTVLGKVLSWPGGPLPRVTAVPLTDKPGDHIAWEMWHDIECAADGSFELRGLPATRTVTVRVFHPMGIAEPEQRAVRADLNSTLPVEFVMKRGDMRAAGIVLDPDGQPVAGAEVRLESVDPRAVMGSFYPGLAEGPVSTVLPVPSALRRSIETGRDGKFDFSIADHRRGTGSLVITATKSGFGAARAPIRTARRDLKLRLPAVDLSGEVRVESRDSRPLPPVEYFLDGASRDDGSGLQTGWYEVRIRRGELELYYEAERAVQSGGRIQLP